MIINNSNINSINDWADFGNYEIGVNVIPANTKNKEPYENWSQWQDKPIRNDLYELRKKKGEYNQEITIVTEKIWNGKNKDNYQWEGFGFQIVCNSDCPKKLVLDKDVLKHDKSNENNVVVELKNKREFNK